MPSKILTDLAPELIIQIFKSSDSFADLTSLSSVSRKLFIIWKTNDNAICEAVLPRAVPCYEQIQELLAARERAERDEHFIFGFQSALDRAKWILKETDTAAKALDCFQKKICKLWAGNWFPVEQAVLTPAERTDFIRAFYRSMTLATLREEPLPSRMLSTWNILDFKQVRDVMRFLVLFCSYDQQLDLGVCSDYNYSHQNIADIMSGERWKAVYSSLIYLGLDLDFLTSEPKDDPDMVAPYFPSLVRDHYQYQYKSTRGARLADLLPLVREKGARYGGSYELSED